MTTKEFIKMLQEADPSGECHVRIPGGIPRHAEKKEGYWDGPYSYINEEGQYVYTTQGSKVDIYMEDIWDFVENNYSKKTSWEDIEKLFVFDLTYSNKESRDERANSILKEAKEAFIEVDEIQRKLYNKSLEEMIDNSNSGWTWFQDKKVDLKECPNWHVYYTWKIYDRWGKDHGSNLHQTQPILESGLWEKHDNGVKEGYYQWIKK
jgi:hypothetical protein